jgi:hypothetical protein
MNRLEITIDAGGGTPRTETVGVEDAALIGSGATSALRVAGLAPEHARLRPAGHHLYLTALAAGVGAHGAPVRVGSEVRIDRKTFEIGGWKLRARVTG